MKITLDIPNETICGFYNYVYWTETGLAMGVKQMGSDELKDGNVLKVEPILEASE